jgi:hypothetical protein
MLLSGRPAAQYLGGMQSAQDRPRSADARSKMKGTRTPPMLRYRPILEGRRLTRFFHCLLVFPFRNRKLCHCQCLSLHRMPDGIITSSPL